MDQDPSRTRIAKGKTDDAPQDELRAFARALPRHVDLFAADAQPEQVGRYLIDGELGRGAMGVVYAGRDSTLERQVAVKVLRGAHAPDSNVLARFRREARALARLSHPGIMTLFDFGEHDDAPYLVLERIEGRTLRDAMDEGLDRAPALRLVAELADALDYLHGEGIVHRDLKPANVFLRSRTGKPVIGDFGLALDMARERLTAQGYVVGTPAYMAPEQVSGRGVAPSDVYALGTMLYEALAGDRPFRAATPQELMVKIRRDPAPPLEVPDLEPELVKVVMTCLAKVPNIRPTAAELATALRRLARTSSSGRHAIPALSPPAGGLTDRRVELDRLREAWTAARAGAVTAHLRGPEGAGKTALAQHFLSKLVEEEGALTVVAGGTGWEPLIEALARELVLLPREEALLLVPRYPAALLSRFPAFEAVDAFLDTRRTARVAPRTDDPSGRAWGALREVLARLAERCPLAFLIDHVAWTPADLRRLVDLVAGAASPRMLFLFASRDALSDADGGITWTTVPVERPRNDPAAS